MDKLAATGSRFTQFYAASPIAKKSPRANGVLDLTASQKYIDATLERIEVGDIWGVSVLSCSLFGAFFGTRYI